MDEHDISAIFPTPEQQQSHYYMLIPIQGRQLIIRNIIEINAQHIFFQKTYETSARRKQLYFNVGSLVYDHLKIKLNAGSQKKIQTIVPLQNLYSVVAEIFNQCPTSIDPVNLVFIQNCNTHYGFFSADGKYVPLCKKCNISVYVFVRGNTIKIICCNPKCKIKILSQNILEPTKQKLTKQKKSKIVYQQEIQPKQQQNPSQKKVTQRVISKQELNLIKKTVNKIYNN